MITIFQAGKSIPCNSDKFFAFNAMGVFSSTSDDIGISHTVLSSFFKISAVSIAYNNTTP